jgi:hypothetical protein
VKLTDQSFMNLQRIIKSPPVIPGHLKNVVNWIYNKKPLVASESQYLNYAEDFMNGREQGESDTLTSIVESAMYILGLEKVWHLLSLIKISGMLINEYFACSYFKTK